MNKQQNNNKQQIQDVKQQIIYDKIVHNAENTKRSVIDNNTPKNIINKIITDHDISATCCQDDDDEDDLLKQYNNRHNDMVSQISHVTKNSKMEAVKPKPKLPPQKKVIEKMESDDEEEEEQEEYEFMDKLKENVKTYSDIDDEIKALNSQIKALKLKQSIEEQEILVHMERLGEQVLDTQRGKIHKKQTETVGKIKPDMINVAVLKHSNNIVLAESVCKDIEEITQENKKIKTTVRRVPLKLTR